MIMGHLVAALLYYYANLLVLCTGTAVTEIKIGVILINDARLVYGYQHIAPAIDLAIQRVNNDFLNASYRIVPEMRSYGPQCDGSEAPGMIHTLYFVNVYYSFINVHIYFIMSTCVCNVILTPLNYANMIVLFVRHYVNCMTSSHHSPLAKYPSLLLLPHYHRHDHRHSHIYRPLYIIIVMSIVTTISIGPYTLSSSWPSLQPHLSAPIHYHRHGHRHSHIYRPLFIVNAVVIDILIGLVSSTFVFTNNAIIISSASFSHFNVGSMCLVRRLHLARSCASSPDNVLSDKSFLMLSNHLRFGLPLLLFPAPPSPSLSCLSTRLLFSLYAHTTSTYAPALSSIFLPRSLSH